MTEHVKACPFDVLEEVKQACLFAEDDGAIGLTNEPYISPELFERILAALRTRPLNGNAELVERLTGTTDLIEEVAVAIGDDWPIYAKVLLAAVEKNRAAIAALSTPHGDAK